MIDYFALLDEARRPWIDPEQLKDRYFARNRAGAADAELNEAFRVLSDPKLRLQHLLTLEDVPLRAGRPVPPQVAELFWNCGALLREVDRWLSINAEAGSALARALLSGERLALEKKLEEQDRQLNATFENELRQLRDFDSILPNEFEKLVQQYDSISYLTRLREQVTEKLHQLTIA
jgi:hypothetical protein